MISPGSLMPLQTYVQVGDDLPVHGQAPAASEAPVSGKVNGGAPSPTAPTVPSVVTKASDARSQPLRQMIFSSLPKGQLVRLCPTIDALKMIPLLSVPGQSSSATNILPNVPSSSRDPKLSAEEKTIEMKQPDSGSNPKKTPPMPPPSWEGPLLERAFSGASAKVKSPLDPLEHLTRMYVNGDQKEWNATGESCHLKMNQSPGTDLVKLQECANAEAMLKAMEYLATTGAGIMPGSLQWKNNVGKIFEDAKLPAGQLSMQICEIFNGRVTGGIPSNNGLQMMTQETGMRGGEEISYVRKPFSDVPDVAENEKRRNLWNLSEGGMVVNTQAPIFRHSWDLASRCLVFSGIGKKASDLSGDKNLKCPIPEAFIVQNASQKNVMDICSKVAIGSKATSALSLAESSDSNGPTQQRMDVMEQLTFLQFLDIIMGNVGRGPSGVMIQETDDGCTVTGIENELALSTKNCSGLSENNTALRPGSISFVTWNIYHAIMGLRPHHIADIMLRNGRGLENGEFKAICNRLEECQRHLLELRKQNKIGNDWTQFAMDRNLANDPNSYAGDWFIHGSMLASE
jgi:hypothetical protein